MPRITAPKQAVTCGVCSAATAMVGYWLCEGCASIEEHALERAEYHNGRADDLRGAGRVEAGVAADQAGRWAGALAAEWSV